MIPPLSGNMVIWSVWLQVAPGAVKLRPRRTQEVRGSPELQNGGPRALNEARLTTFWLRHFAVKSGRFLCFFGRLLAGLAEREVWHGESSLRR